MNSLKIAFIGFGEAGRVWSESLLALGGVSVRAYDILLESDQRSEIETVAEALGVTLAETPADAIRDADFVFSAVTAAESLRAAQSVATDLVTGQVFFDINSVSPERKKKTAGIVNASGATYLDMAVMAPVSRSAHKVSALIAGRMDRDTTERLEALGFEFQVVGEEPGMATTIKMIRSLFVKGLEALTVQSLLAAKDAGCYDRIYASLSKSFEVLDWPSFPAYQFERVATHGVRRSEEMHECAATLADLGFPEGAGLAEAIANVQGVVGSVGVDLTGSRDPEQAAAEVLAGLRKMAPE